jgi:hypothetical protein
MSSSDTKERQMGSEIESEVIGEFGYVESTEAGKSVLSITFRKSGQTVEYVGVPREVVGAMLMAPSAGAYFVKNIRNEYTFRGVAIAA